MNKTAARKALKGLIALAIVQKYFDGISKQELDALYKKRVEAGK